MKFLLVLTVLAFAAFHLWQHVCRGYLRGTPGTRTKGRTAHPMVSCACCGVHIPQHEAFCRAGRMYCSLVHARKAPLETAASVPCTDTHVQHEP